MPSMQDRHTLRTALLATVMAVCAVAAAAQSRAETYPFIDEITGLSIDLPSAWERRDLRRMGATLSPLNDEYYGPCWLIRSSAERLNPAVIVPDPGDGSARKLAERILAAIRDG